MRSQDLIEGFTAIAKEKNIDKTELGTILEELFLSLLEKHFSDASNCSVIVNIDKGELEIYQEKAIVKEVTDPLREIELEKAKLIEPGLQVGDPFIEVIDPVIFGRRLVNTAKQFLAQKIRDVEKKYIFENYYNRVGEIVIGDVRQVQPDNVFVHIDQSELRLPKSDQIPGEKYRRGDTIRSIVKSVEMSAKGPDILISRSDNRFLYKLFEMEVPEIEDGIIEILAISRIPGERAKVIVNSQDKRIDPVGACVGMRGSRIQSIVRELNGEKIDIINYSSQPEVLISRALSPAKPLNLYIDDETKYCVAVFDDGDMDQAVGRSYQNVKLASQVTQYQIEAVKKSEYSAESPGESKKEQESSGEVRDSEAIYIKDLDNLTSRMKSLLQEAEVNTVQDFFKKPKEELLSVKGLGEKILASIEERLQNYLEKHSSIGGSNNEKETVTELSSQPAPAEAPIQEELKQAEESM